MILQAIDYIERISQLLHHHRARAAQVVRRPSTIFAAGQHQGVVAAPILQWRAWRAILVLLEHRLAVADLLADRLPLDAAVIVPGREAPGAVAGVPVQFLALVQRERRQVHGQVGDVVLDVFLRDEPSAGGQVDALPAHHGRLADAAQGRQHDPDRTLGGGPQRLPCDALARRSSTRPRSAQTGSPLSWARPLPAF